MAKYCSNCGTELHENQDVCLNCGTSVKKESKDFFKDNDINMVLFVILLIVFWPAAIIYLLVKKK